MSNHEAILEAFESRYPYIDPRWSYCLFTGAPIAEVDSYTFKLMLDLTQGTPEEAAESLMLRILNTSRPSPIWTMVRESDMVMLRERSPCQLLAYLRNGATGLRKDKSDFHSLMIARIESFITICGLEDDELDSAFTDYYMEANRKAEEESKVARRMRSWLMSQTEEGREAERRLRIEALESRADAIRINKWAKAERLEALKRGKTKAQRKAEKKAERKSFFDSIFTEIMNADAELLKPVDEVLTQPDSKPAFRIALPKKDS